MATTLAHLERFADAERLAATAATAGTASLGERHLVTIAAHDARAVALLGLRRGDEAERLLRQQLAILDDRKSKGEDAGEGEPLTAMVRTHLGMALAALGRRPEAEALLLQGVPRLRPQVAATTRAVRFLVTFYDQWNRVQPDAARATRAAEWRQRLAASPGPADNARGLNGLTCAAYLAKAGRDGPCRPTHVAPGDVVFGAVETHFETQPFDDTATSPL